MAYQFSHYFYTGNTNDCRSDNHWWPDGSDALRDQISNIYMGLFGRYGEQAGVEYWLSSFTSPNNNYPPGDTSLYTFIYNGGLYGGELGATSGGNQHTGMALGGCPIFGCTNPLATNYNANATQDDGSCIIPSGCTDTQANNFTIQSESDSIFDFSDRDPFSEGQY